MQLEEAQFTLVVRVICTSSDLPLTLVNCIGMTVLNHRLTLSDRAFCKAFQFRLGLSPRPMHAPRVCCGCVALVDPPPGSPEPDFFQHAQKCPKLAAARSAGHTILCGAWCQVMQSAGVPT